MHSEWIWDFLWHYSRSGTLKSWPTYTNTREMYKILKFHPEKLSGKKKKKSLKHGYAIKFSYSHSQKMES